MAIAMTMRNYQGQGRSSVAFVASIQPGGGGGGTGIHIHIHINIGAIQEEDQDATKTKTKKAPYRSSWVWTKYQRSSRASFRISLQCSALNCIPSSLSSHTASHRIATHRIAMHRNTREGN